jgi:regulator of sirC expression with transglutaminase-like and TPR domain
MKAEAQASEALLREIGAAPNAQFDLIEAGFALAVLERAAHPSGGISEQSLTRPRRHVEILRRDVAAEGKGARLALDRVKALTAVMVERFGYRGDVDGYDELHNADMIQVIERRKGLPVTLGILFIQVARAQGWRASGLAFPGHFLISVEGEDGRAILDPFHEGRRPDIGSLRRLLQATEGEDAQLTEGHCAPVSDRDVLLRLQNNIKLRLIRMGRLEAAATTLDRMLMMAPEDSGLWQECAVLQAELGAIDRAQAAIDAALALPISETARSRLTALRQQLRRSLH